MLRRWFDGIKLTPEEPRKLPVWVKLFSIPESMFHVKAISFIASRFGRPLFTDFISAKQRRLDYARVCVELDATKGLCREGKFYKLSGEPYFVKPEYEWTPLHCPACQVFGHTKSNCPAKAKANIAGDSVAKIPPKAPEWKQVGSSRRETKIIGEESRGSPMQNLENSEVINSPSLNSLQIQKSAVPLKKMDEPGPDITPAQTAREAEICRTPPFGPIPTLLAKSPQLNTPIEEEQSCMPKVKSIIVDQKQRKVDKASNMDESPLLQTNNGAVSTNNASSPSLASKLRKKVKKKHA